MSYEPPASPPGETPLDVLAAFKLVEEAGLLGGISIDRWDALPEDLCRDHELDRGRLIKRQSGSPGHQTATRRLANALEAAARSAVRNGVQRCLTINQDLDVRLWDVPGSTVRRPDVVAYRCLSRGEKLWASHVLLVVEVVSPSSEATDTGHDNRRTGFESKMSQYASAGIECYWIVRLRADDSAIDRIEEWRLAPEEGIYLQAALWRNDTNSKAVTTDLPFPIVITWADLEF